MVPGSGGVRKLRCGVAGRGKRGGGRIIYFSRTAEGVIWMLTIYAKNEAENNPAPVRPKIQQELGDDQG